MTSLNTRDWTTVFTTLFDEIVFGSPHPSSATYMLNRGDAGLLRSLDAISAADASAGAGGGASIAAHAEHLRYGFNLANRWASGERDPWKSADWTQAWAKPRVTDAEWRTLRADLRREAEAWRAALSEARELPEAAANWLAGSIAHTAYHLGAIRQIDRSTRGPTAEDERSYSA